MGKNHANEDSPRAAAPAAPPLPDPPSLSVLAALSVALLVACAFAARGPAAALHAAVAGLGWAVVAGLLALVCRRWVAS